MVIRPSYLYNWDPYTGKMTFLHWDRPLILNCLWWNKHLCWIVLMKNTIITWHWNCKRYWNSSYRKSKICLYYHFSRHASDALGPFDICDHLSEYTDSQKRNKNKTVMRLSNGIRRLGVQACPNYASFTKDAKIASFLGHGLYKSFLFYPSWETTSHFRPP